MTAAFSKLAAAAGPLFLALASGPAIAQASPEQRIERLERQVQQVQRRVFPQGQPADTAGYAFQPAATQASVSNIDNRLGVLEQQMAAFLRQSEENAFKLTQMEAELTRLRAQEARVKELESRLGGNMAAAAAVPASSVSTPPAPKLASVVVPSTGSNPAAPPDAGEEAYDVGYELWRAGKYDQAITALRAMASSFPQHRRVSWANNLAGRAMLDKGEPRAAAEALLSNYRSNPKGERAADSLFYLGQSLVKLGQPAQACKAYAELEAVYGASMRGELQRLLPPAKSQARCG
jgi:TolA-binding protein